MGFAYPFYPTHRTSSLEPALCLGSGLGLGFWFAFPYSLTARTSALEPVLELGLRLGLGLGLGFAYRYSQHPATPHSSPR